MSTVDQITIGLTLGLTVINYWMILRSVVLLRKIEGYLCETSHCRVEIVSRSASPGRVTEDPITP